MPGINAVQSTEDASSQTNISPTPPDSMNSQMTQTAQRRVWSDGCFDMVHFGHANNLRQAKNLGDYLIVGIHSDAEITLHKGPPVFTEEERCVMVKGIKWVDEVVCGAPYVTTIQTLDEYNCNFCAHGNDITTTADGKDTYQEVKDAGRYREVYRTQGVSTTQLIERMLSVNRPFQGKLKSGVDLNANVHIPSPYTGSGFLLTARKIREFSTGFEIPAGAKVVYVDGAFDVLHPGHLGFLEEASKMGDYLIAGVHPDEVVTQYKGTGYPIMNLQERCYALLGCKFVTEIVFGAGYTISQEMLDHLNVSFVCHGKTTIENDPETGLDPYALPKEKGICRIVDSKSDFTTEKVVARIEKFRPEFEERNRKKQIKELGIIKAMEMNSNQAGTNNTQLTEHTQNS